MNRSNHTFTRRQRKNVICSAEQYREQQYVQAKNHWLAAHPEATHEQLEAAMLAIAREMKI